MTDVRCPACGANLSACGPKPDGTVDCPQCGRTVHPSAETVAEVLVPPGPAPTLTFDPGSGALTESGTPVIPGYEVLEEVGRGGMGVVYKARQLNPPRVVAVKMILAGEHADPEQLSRFRAEAEAIARLTHPAIAQIHQVGNWQPPAGGPAVPFLTLEFVPGQPLWRRLQSKQPVGARPAAALVQQLARAVHYAHQQGIIHRDLKPANVLLCGAEGPDSLGDIKIVDFGLAKPLDGFASTVTDGPHTRTGAILGTPSYMAPEQVAAKGKIGPPADVYALGAILYELLTGRPPFAGESALETLLQVTKDDPDPPRRLRANVPRDLETICLTCLAKDPAQRYASAAELAKDLGRFLADEPVKVRPPSSLARLGRWARRHKEHLYLAGGMAVAAVVVLAVVLARPETESNRPEPPKPPPISPVSLDDSSLVESRRRMISTNNLKQIGMALHNIHDALGALPPAAICDKSGKPLLSWRVAILPYIEGDILYKQFHLDEPWDSEHNKKLIGQMPRQFAVEGKSSGPPNTTHYQAIVGRGAAWEPQPPLGGLFGRTGLTLSSFTDGLSSTVVVAEAHDPVLWTKPDDLTFDGTALPKFGGTAKNGFHVLMGDGSVLFVRDTAQPEDLRAALTRTGDETLPVSWNAPPSGAETGPGHVRGKVTLNGKPLVNGKIVVAAERERNGLSVSLNGDGTYSLNLPPGTYRVAIETRPGAMQKTEAPSAPRVPPRYTDTTTSGLMLQVRSGEQVTNFELVDPVPKK